MFTGYERKTEPLRRINRFVIITFKRSTPHTSRMDDYYSYYGRSRFRSHTLHRPIFNLT